MKIVHHFCGKCEEYVPAVQNQCNHLLHLLLTLFTVGLWLLVWVFCAFNQTSHCQRCGNRTVGGQAGTQIHRGVSYVGLFVLAVLAAAVAASRMNLDSNQRTVAIFIVVVGGSLFGLVLNGRRKKS